MDEKVVQRRNKSSGKNHQENLLLTAKKRKQQRNSFKPIYLIITFIVLASLYLILTRLILVEYTNVSIKLPKLVNDSISERFWGTYR